jgi:hypothetical protein
MAALRPTPEESSVPPGEPPDENNASAASDSHCAALSRNILAIIPIATGHEVAGGHFVETNSFVKSHENQMLTAELMGRERQRSVCSLTFSGAF